MDSPEEAAAVLAARRALGLVGGVVVANPIPEADALPADLVNGALEKALADASAAGLRGAALTPFVLGRIGEATAGRSVPANVALARNNAILAARIAVALNSLNSGGWSGPRS